MQLIAARSTLLIILAGLPQHGQERYLTHLPVASLGKILLNSWQLLWLYWQLRIILLRHAVVKSRRDLFTSIAAGLDSLFFSINDFMNKKWLTNFCCWRITKVESQ